MDTSTRLYWQTRTTDLGEPKDLKVAAKKSGSLVLSDQFFYLYFLDLKKVIFFGGQAITSPLSLSDRVTKKIIFLRFPLASRCKIPSNIERPDIVL